MWALSSEAGCVPASLWLTILILSPGVSSFAPPPRPVDLEDDPIALGKQQDIQAVGRLFLETVILALVDVQARCNVSRDSIERLIMEVFPGDFDGLRYVHLEIRPLSAPFRPLLFVLNDLWLLLHGQE